MPLCEHGLTSIWHAPINKEDRKLCAIPTAGQQIRPRHCRVGQRARNVHVIRTDAIAEHNRRRRHPWPRFMAQAIDQQRSVMTGEAKGNAIAPYKAPA
jgi:hypothetical protein